jgi:uncharacterized membrane protein
LNLLFKALRDPTRRRILEMLKERDLTAGQIAEAFSMTAPSISYHLDLLRHAQLVSSRKRGQFVTYSLETTVLDDSLADSRLDEEKKTKMKPKVSWLEIVMLAAPFIVLAIYWNDLPSRIPVHWNIRGEIDGWSRKIPGLFLLPLTMLGVVTLLHILPRFDPRLQLTTGAESRMPAVLPIIRVAFLALFNTIFFVQIGASLGKTVAAGRIIMTCVLLFFVVLGNYLGNVRPNYFIGIRTPWTLENPETWRATHRLGGRLMFFGALILLVGQLFLSEQHFGLAFMVGILSLAVWGFVYSWHHCRTHVATR